MAATDNDNLQKAIIYRSQHIAIELEPLGVEERTGSVQLGINVTFKGQRQSLHWVHRAWVLYSALNKFEEALRSHQQATLIDMSMYPILQITADNEPTWLVLNPEAERQSSDGELLTVRLRVELGLPTALADSFRAFPKWW